MAKTLWVTVMILALAAFGCENKKSHDDIVIDPGDNNGGATSLPPTMTSVSPSSGHKDGGTAITVTGTNFSASATLTVGGTAATSVVVASATSITAVTPAGAVGTATVKVVNPDGLSASISTGFTYLLYSSPAPNVNSIFPSTGSLTGGTEVTVAGTGFQDGSTVFFGEVEAASTSFVDSGELAAVAPAGAAGAVSISVVNPDTQSATLASAFTYISYPSISSISPAQGPVLGGATVFITGSGFQLGATVTFGSTVMPSSFVNSSHIAAASPAGSAGLVDVTVTNPDGQTDMLELSFELIPAPTMSSVLPSYGTSLGGEEITISGTNLLGTPTVYFGTTLATSVTLVNSGELTLVTPALAAGTYDIKVVNPDGQYIIDEDSFTFFSPPSVSSVSPEFGPLAGGGSVTITGSGFVSGASVQFGTESVSSPAVMNATSITATVPAPLAKGWVSVTVTNPDGQSSVLSNAFLYRKTVDIDPVFENSTSADPVASASGDFNGDGIADVAVLSEADFVIDIFICNNDGSFTLESNVPLDTTDPGYPSDMVCADFDGDGADDLAVAFYGNSTEDVGVYICDGDGSFQAPNFSDVSGNATKLTAGRFDSDLDVDLIVSDDTWTSEQIIFLPNNGSGTFGAETATACTSTTAPGRGAGGDFDDDGNLDIALACPVTDNITVFLGNGDGSFSGPDDIGSGGTQPEDLVTADFDGDGILDLVSCDYLGGDLSLYIGDGSGGFSMAGAFDQGTLLFEPYDIASADFDGDGNADLAVMSASSTISLSDMFVLFGDGAGTFTANGPPLGLHYINMPSISLGDFDGDGLTDAAVTDYRLDLMLSLRNNGSGLSHPYTASADIAPGVPVFIVGVETIEASNDLYNEVITSISDGSGSAYGLMLFENNADVSFTRGPMLSDGLSGAENPVALAVADFNNDFVTDAAVLNNNAETVSVFLGNSNLFTGVTCDNYDVSLITLTDLKAGDLNNDGFADLMITDDLSSTVSVFLNDGDGTFGGMTSYDLGANCVGPLDMHLADFNDDGNIDILLLCNPASYTVGIMFGNGDGSLTEATVYFNTSATLQCLLAADLDADGDMDMAAGNEGMANTVEIFINDGTGVFASSASYTLSGGVPLGLACMDVNDDGYNDIVCAEDPNIFSSSDEGQIGILTGRPDGTFDAEVVFDTICNPRLLTSGDFNNDNILDITVTGTDGRMAIHLNLSY